MNRNSQNAAKNILQMDVIYIATMYCVELNSKKYVLLRIYDVYIFVARLP